MTEKSIDAILLDTHVWVWLNEGSAELKTKIIKRIDHAAQTDGVFISIISVWEIAMLVSKKRLILQLPIAEWISQALAQPGVTCIPLSTNIAIESTDCINPFHGDLADRMIIATARIKNLTLLTRDTHIIHYAKQGFLNALKV